MGVAAPITLRIRRRLRRREHALNHQPMTPISAARCRRSRSLTGCWSAIALSYWRRSAPGCDGPPSVAVSPRFRLAYVKRLAASALPAVLGSGCVDALTDHRIEHTADVLICLRLGHLARGHRDVVARVRPSSATGLTSRRRSWSHVGQDSMWRARRPAGRMEHCSRGQQSSRLSGAGRGADRQMWWCA